LSLNSNLIKKVWISKDSIVK